ncbi:MAG: hypothetical protein II828_01005 [Clostridia bacterium]|nr:hypothetical protein [Clostridia bacterium]MBQ4396080.1 hypothetical protein [Clostridia bacterium]
MATFRFKISSPDGNLFDGAAEMVSVRGAEGDLAVMAGHIPFVTTVQPCDCTVDTEDGERRVGHTEGGLLSVTEQEATLFSWNFRWNEA